MTNLFLLILNMSITASYVAFAVISVRFLLRRAPKLFSYLLWSVVAIRLVIPVSFFSSFSIFRMVKPQVRAGTGYMEFVSQDMMVQKNPVQFLVWIGSIVWITGAVILLLYSVTSYLKIRARIRTATLVKDHIFESDQIVTPFVCGFLKPNIYIPAGMSEQERSYVFLHEQTHIIRRDYLIKPFAFMILIIHWFNPLMWLCYALMSKDMEMSCDERVVSKMGNQIKGRYAETLLSLSVSRSGLRTGDSIAFGESNVKARIKNILAYRQPSSWTVAGSALVIAALIAGCIVNPKPLQQSLQLPLQATDSERKQFEELQKYVQQFTSDETRLRQFRDYIDSHPLVKPILPIENK